MEPGPRLRRANAQHFDDEPDDVGQEVPLARRRRHRAAETFDDDEYRRVTLYNLGLSYEGLERWRDAALVYAEVVATWPGSGDATFALFRLAECRPTLGDSYAVPPLMRSALSRAGTSSRGMPEKARIRRLSMRV